MLCVGALLVLLPIPVLEDDRVLDVGGDRLEGTLGEFGVLPDLRGERLTLTY